VVDVVGEGADALVAAICVEVGVEGADAGLEDGGTETPITVVERADEWVMARVGAKDFGEVVVDAAEDTLGVGGAAVDVAEGAAGVGDAAGVVAIVVGAEVVEAVGEGELVASASSGVGDARKDGKAEDADDPVAEALNAAGEVGDTSDEVDEGACAAVADAMIVGALLIRASASSILRNIRSIRLERASMAADSESVVVEGVEAMALDPVEKGLGKKWVEKNKALITNCYEPSPPNHNSKSTRIIWVQF